MKTRPPQHSAKASTKSARQRRIRLDGHVIVTEFRGALLPPGETVGAFTELTACVDQFGSHGYPVTSPRKLITNLRRHRNEVCCDNNSDPRAGPTDTFDDRLWVRRSQGSSTWSSASWASRASIARPPRGHRKGARGDLLEALVRWHQQQDPIGSVMQTSKRTATAVRCKK